MEATSNSILIISSIILPVVGGFVGYFLKHYLDKKKELLSEATNKRREAYQDFIGLLLDIINNPNKYEGEIFKEKMYEFYKKYLLYASPQVVISVADLFQYLYTGDSSSSSHIKNLIQRVSRIAQTMREDLGLSNEGLGKNGELLLRAMFTDYEKIMA